MTRKEQLKADLLKNFSDFQKIDPNVAPGGSDAANTIVAEGLADSIDRAIDFDWVYSGIFTAREINAFEKKAGKVYIVSRSGTLDGLKKINVLAGDVVRCDGASYIPVLQLLPTGSVADHEAKNDPHNQYAMKSALDDGLAGKAPKNHSSTDTTYGEGDATNYGHVKVDPELSDDSINPVQNKVVKEALDAKYTKPSGGIPKSDLASAVQTSLDLADSALQQHQSLDGYVNGIATDSTTEFVDFTPIVVGKSGKNLLTRTASNLKSYCNQGMATISALNSGLLEKQNSLPSGTDCEYEVSVARAVRPSYHEYYNGGNFSGAIVGKTTFTSSSSNEQLLYKAIVSIDNSATSGVQTASNLTMLLTLRGRGPSDIKGEIKVIARNGYSVSGALICPLLVLSKINGPSDYNYFIGVELHKQNDGNVVTMENSNIVNVAILSDLDSCEYYGAKILQGVGNVAYTFWPAEILQCEHVLSENSNADSPVSWALSYWSNLPTHTTKVVYNRRGKEHVFIFAKGDDGYGTILGWSYDTTKLKIIRIEGGSAKSTEWEGLDADSVGGKKFIFGSYVADGSVCFV